MPCKVRAIEGVLTGVNIEPMSQPVNIGLYFIKQAHTRHIFEVVECKIKNWQN